MSKSLAKTGELAWQKMEKINSELFTFTYGAMVTQLLRDYEQVEEVNKQLDKMGYNIGIRIIDEYAAKSDMDYCANFKDTANAIGKVAFKMFLGNHVEIVNWNEQETTCSLLIYDNPMNAFVELPGHLKDKLWYSNILCGVVRGALEMVQVKVNATFVKDVLHGDDCTEMRIEYLGKIQDEMGAEYQET